MIHGQLEFHWSSFTLQVAAEPGAVGGRMQLLYSHGYTAVNVVAADKIAPDSGRGGFHCRVLVLHCIWPVGHRSRFASGPVSVVGFLRRQTDLTVFPQTAVNDRRFASGCRLKRPDRQPDHPRRETMPTGACGIDCDVCKLRVMGICSSCGPGNSSEAERKLEAQRRLIGDTCSILECAVLNRVEYCLRDCSAFPCDNFSMGPYPFAAGFLNMQQRRRRELPPAVDWNNRPIQVPDEFWETLAGRDLRAVSNFVLAEADSEGGLVFPFLKASVRIDPQRRALQQFLDGQWHAVSDPMLTLVSLLYFNRVDHLVPLAGELAAAGDLSCAGHFSGHHALKMAPLLERYANDPEGFRQSAELHLGGKPTDMADLSFLLSPFPRIPLHYLFWKADEEYEARIDVLFDRSIEALLTAAGIWSLIWRVNVELLRV
jgi:hypothetical protein